MSEFSKNQYNLLCSSRLNQLKPVIKEQLTQEQKKIYKESITGLDKHSEICCIGQIFISAEKPTIFDEINKKDYNFNFNNYRKKELKFSLEDADGKARIIFENEPFLVTGQVIGVEGRVETGVIYVKNIIYPGNEYLKNTKKYFDGETVMFASNVTAINELELLLDTLDEQKVVKLIIVGIQKSEYEKLRKIFKRISRIQVFLIPEDLNVVRCLPFCPYTDIGLKMNLLPNPAVIENILFVPRIVLNDLLKYHPKQEEDFSPEKYTDAAEILLKSRHCCPTAPDTIKCTPFDEDPFVLDPDINCIVVSGDEFLHEERNNMHFLQLPDFSKTSKSVLLVNNLFKIVNY